MLKLEYIFIAIIILVYSLHSAHAQDQPPLPPGLTEETDNKIDEQILPPGLSQDDQSSLPEGLTENTFSMGDETMIQKKPIELPFDITGFFELRAGTRLQHDPHEKSNPVGEARLQVEFERQWTKIGFKLTSDFVYDTVVARNRIQLNRGEGWLDLREANLVFTPTYFMDIKVGRQIMTWGTGDLIFINDLFTKDWNSFFIGRDTEYLKAPSDTIKVSLFSGVMNIDIYYSPSFDHDRYIDGRRISYWNSAIGKRAGRNRIIRTHRPNEWFHDHEAGCRLYKNIFGFEIAFYGYEGFWKSPGGMDPRSGKATFPDLSVYGISLRGRFFKGIGSLEFGYYDSEDDQDGNNPYVKNSEIRFLAGYDQEIAKDFTIAVQYYVEHMRHFHSYRENLPPGAYPHKHNRHLFTLRITKLLMNQNLILSLFTYLSPSESDVYLRPKIQYKVSDDWIVETGGNIFYGRHSQTFFGQFEKNTNIFLNIRRYFNFV